jgi:glutamyl-tRNA reductase
MLARPERPLFLMDVAVPRDVDPEVARIPGVELVDIDRMGESVDVTLEHRRAAIPLVEAIVADHLSIFDVWYRSRAAIPVISSLSQKAESIRSAEVARVFGRCPELSERERILIAGMSLTIVSRLLHSVITKIRDDASAEAAEVQARTRMIDELFELRLDEAKLQAEPWMAAFTQPPLAPDADVN